MAEQQDRGVWIPDDHRAAAIPSVACLPIESYAYLSHYYIFYVMQPNPILTHHGFKYLYASDPKVVPPATIFPDSSIQQLLEHFHLDVKQAFQT